MSDDRLDNNIEMGTAYLHLLLTRYLEEIRDPVSREYCAIAAYNTGAGNVLAAFSGDREQAVKRINSTPSGEVYVRLRTSLSSGEARRYVVKVTEAKRRYVRL